MNGSTGVVIVVCISAIMGTREATPGSPQGQGEPSRWQRLLICWVVRCSLDHADIVYYPHITHVNPSYYHLNG